MYRKSKQHIHLVGIGGIGMSGIAHLLLHLGYRVSGSDVRKTAITQELARKGAVVHRGHSAANVNEADIVVVSSAIGAGNPEVEAARGKGVPVIPRARILAELMQLKKFGIAVSGTHGKTSTTSMVASVLQAASMDPTVIIGGQVKTLGGNARWGLGDFLLAEADESDGSFLCLTPSIAVITNVDAEHLDYYGDMESVEKAFESFSKKVPFYGRLYCAVMIHTWQGSRPALKKGP